MYTVIRKLMIGLLMSMLAVGAMAFGDNDSRLQTRAAEGDDNKKLTEEITAVLTTQADAWNRGDIDSFMTGYLQSPDTSYAGNGTLVQGYDALRDRYIKKYGTERGTMGKLSFSDLKISQLGKDNALCIGAFHLLRDNTPAIDGLYTLIFVKTPSGWKVIHDHTSTP